MIRKGFETTQFFIKYYFSKFKLFSFSSKIAGVSFYRFHSNFLRLMKFRDSRKALHVAPTWC